MKYQIKLTEKSKEYYFHYESEFQFKEDNKKEIEKQIDQLLDHTYTKEDLQEYILGFGIRQFLNGYIQAKKEV